MAVAGLLTVLAISGIFAGVLAGKAQRLSAWVGAAGSGLLVGIACFWLLPEISQRSSTPAALLLVLFVTLLLVVSDQYLLHSVTWQQSGVMNPLFLATSVHSFLDGWSVRALSVEAVAQWPVFAGLALHKIPEGIALGWIARRSFSSVRKALLVSCGVELFTLLGAFAEARSQTSGFSTFGSAWELIVLAIVAGSFCFVGLHTIIPYRRRPDVIAIFLTTLLVLASFSVWKH